MIKIAVNGSPALDQRNSELIFSFFVSNCNYALIKTHTTGNENPIKLSSSKKHFFYPLLRLVEIIVIYSPQCLIV